MAGGGGCVAFARTFSPFASGTPPAGGRVEMQRNPRGASVVRFISELWAEERVSLMRERPSG